MRTESVKVQRVRYSPSLEPGTCILCHLIYLQVIKVHWFNLFDKPGLTCSLASDYRWITTRKPKTLSLALPTSKLYCSQELKQPGISYDQIFLQSLHNKKNNNKNWRNSKRTHISLSLSTCRSADGMFTLMCLHQSLSLSLSLGSRSDPNGIQDRMFRQFKNVCMR